MSSRSIFSALVLCLLFCGPSSAQDLDLRPPEPAMPKSLPMQSKLYDAQALALSGQLTVGELRRKLATKALTVRHDGRVLVEIAGPQDADPIGDAFLAPYGGVVERTWRNYSKTWIPVAQLTAVALALPEGYFMDGAPRYHAELVEGEGPLVTNTAAYRDLGLDGDGITIGVIDTSYRSLASAQSVGDAPASPTKVNLTATSFEGGRSRHGTGCTEIIYDHAPDADYRLYKVNTVTDFGAAIDDAIANGVDIVSHSLSWFNTGWFDNEGPICDGANLAGNNDILFFTAAGNRADQHWQGSFNDPDGDEFHEFMGSDETINVDVPDGGEILCWLSWDHNMGVADYDLLLLTATGTLLDSSTNGGNFFEFVQWQNTTGATEDVRLVVFHDGTVTPEFELFIAGRCTQREYIIAENSTTCPSNASNPNVISVAAVDQLKFTADQGTNGIATIYSGRGPTNDGMIVPDLTGPTEIRTSSYIRFNGTSAATPNAAGVAAVLLSCDNTMSAASVRDQLFTWADCLRDWGDAGLDTVYGYGGVNMPPYDDCNTNGIADACEIFTGAVFDDNCNGIPDIFACDGVDFTYLIPSPLAPYNVIDGSGLISAFPTITEPFSNPGFPAFIQGFAMGLAHDPQVLIPVNVQPGPDLALLGNGQGPEFFAPAILGNGVTVGCIFDLNSVDVIEFDEPRQVVQVDYDTNTQLLAGNTNGGPTVLAFTDTLGNPPVENTIAGDTGTSYVPLPLPQVFDLQPEFPYQFRAGIGADQTGPELHVEYDPQAINSLSFSAELGVAPRHPGVAGPLPLPMDAFSMSVAHDPSLMTAVSVAPTPCLMALNNGNGPDVLVMNVLPDGVTITADFGNDSIPVPCFIPLIEVEYATGAAAFVNDVDGEISHLQFVPLGSNPIVTNEITAQGFSAPPDLYDGTIVFTPLNVTFIRGDGDGNGVVNGLLDGLYMLNFQFLGGPTPPCMEAADADGNSVFNGLIDGLYILEHQFLGGPPPPAPFPSCGPDPDPGNTLGCDEHACF